jgi:hypothetical protein
LLRCLEGLQSSALPMQHDPLLFLGLTQTTHHLEVVLVIVHGNGHEQAQQFDADHPHPATHVLMAV